MGFVESVRRWSATEFGGYGEFKRDNFLTEKKKPESRPMVWKLLVEVVLQGWMSEDCEGWIQ